jgi:hypothetical protein
MAANNGANGCEWVRETASGFPFLFFLVVKVCQAVSQQHRGVSQAKPDGAQAVD